MARRTKSIADIIAQRKRINAEIARRAEAAGRTDNDGFLSDMRDISRYGRVNEIAGRYTNNIRNTKAYQRDWDAFDRASSKEDVYRVYDKRVNRQYSRRTYMGLAQG